MPLDGSMRACFVPIFVLPALLLSACGTSQPTPAQTPPVPAPTPTTADAPLVAPVPAETETVDPLTSELREPKLLNELPGESASPAPPNTTPTPRDGSIIIKGDQPGAISDPP